jgi:hypothetical protein
MRPLSRPPLNSSNVGSGPEAMVLKFSNTVDDIVAFNRYHCSASPQIRTAKRKQHLLFVLMLGAFATSLLAYTRSPFVAAGTFGAGLAGLVLSQTLLKETFARRRDELVRRMLLESSNDGILGPRRLSVLEDRLEEESATSRNSVRYEAIGRLEETPQYVFIYLNSQQAVVVPKREVAPTELEAFMRVLRQKLPPNSPLSK